MVKNKEVFMKSLHENSVGIWVWRHEEYLRQHRHITYMTLLTSGELDAYLAQIETQASEMMAMLIAQLAEQEGITEQLKAENQLEWVRWMNCIKARAKEIVSATLIYS